MNVSIGKIDTSFFPVRIAGLPMIIITAFPPLYQVFKKCMFVKAKAFFFFFLIKASFYTKMKHYNE